MIKRAELLSHVHNTNTQYNNDRICTNLSYKSNRKLVDGRFADPSAQKSVDLDIQLINYYDKLLVEIEYYIQKHAKINDYQSHMLVKCRAESAGKSYGTSGAKIGNAHLKWAFSEAAVIFLRDNPKAKAYVAKMTKRHNKGKALSILEHKLGRAVYFILKRKQPFNMCL